MAQPGDPGTYVGRDGNWYDADGNNLGPSGQGPTPTTAQHGGTADSGGTPAAGNVGQPTAPPPTPPPTGTNPLAPFSGTFTPPTGNAPLPAVPTYPAFVQPTAADALNDQGYQFVRDQGQNALQNWAAAKGTLNDSETADALINYGQQAASTQFGNVYNRAAQTYNTNVATQFEPQIMNWQAQIGQNNLQQSNSWNQFLQEYKQYLDRFNSTLGVATAA